MDYFIVFLKFYTNLHEAGRESSLLDRPIRDKLDPEAVRRGLNILGHLVSTICSDERSSRVVAISDLKKVVNTVVMILNLKRLEF